MRGDELVVRTAWEAHVGTGRAATAELDSLLQRHREPVRRYHGVTHVAWVLRHVAELAADEPVDDLDAIVAAACFHDAVYRPDGPGSGADERASADLAERTLAGLGWTADRTRRVHDAIVATAHLTDDDDGGDSSGGDRALPHDTAVLVDADLAVLGAEPNAYDAYRRGVRLEYEHLDDATWRDGRRAVLRRLATLDPIFLTATGRRRWERRAHANLAAELRSLD